MPGIPILTKIVSIHLFLNRAYHQPHLSNDKQAKQGDRAQQ